MAQTGAVYSATEFARPIVDREQWAFISSQPSLQPYYHLSGGNLLLSTNALGFDVSYISTNWVVGKDKISADGDLFNIPEALIVRGAVWRWKRQKGFPFDDVLAEYEADIAAEIKADRGA